MIIRPYQSTNPAYLKRTNSATANTGITKPDMYFKASEPQRREDIVKSALSKINPDSPKDVLADSLDKLAINVSPEEINENKGMVAQVVPFLTDPDLVVRSRALNVLSVIGTGDINTSTKALISAFTEPFRSEPDILEERRQYNKLSTLNGINPGFVNTLVKNLIIAEHNSVNKVEAIGKQQENNILAKVKGITDRLPKMDSGEKMDIVDGLIKNMRDKHRDKIIEAIDKTLQEENIV